MAATPRSRTDSQGRGEARPGSSGEVSRLASWRRQRRRRRLLTAAISAALTLLAVEVRTSGVQAHLFSLLAGPAESTVREGPSPRALDAPAGPYDRRLGYHRLPETIDRLVASGFSVAEQARPSDRLRWLTRRGLFPVYDEKERAGLRVRGVRGGLLYRSLHPGRTYGSFGAIPPVLVRSLLFIENRELLESGGLYRNPAVEWDRLALAAARWIGSKAGGDGRPSGASTLATQIEKFRHSPGGLTRGPMAKLRQMLSASLRAYADGPATDSDAREVVLAYLNSVPLAGIPGHGEVIGLPEGLWAWYGLDPTRVSDLLGRGDAGAPDGPRRPRDGGGRGLHLAGGGERSPPGAGSAYRAAVSLMVAQRRPTHYLVRPEGRAELARLTDRYLRLFLRRGVVPARLGRAALEARPRLRDRAPPAATDSSPGRRGSYGHRGELLDLLGSETLYELDRLDLAVRSTIDARAQAAVEVWLRQLDDAPYVRRHGLSGPGLLERGDPARVRYSVVVFEHTPRGRAVRIQADDRDGPVDLSDGGRLQLGSTAKLRVLVTYLRVVEELYRDVRDGRRDTAGGTAARRGRRPSSRGGAEEALPDDPLTRWVRGHLERRPQSTLPDVLDAALERRYSASPAERFFTGGGIHTFSNFDSADDDRAVSVREAFRRSVNLAFVRLLEDVVAHHVHRLPGYRPGLLSDPDHPGRRRYLERFAHREGRRLVARYHDRFRGRSRAGLEAAIAASAHPSPRGRAWALRAADPDATPGELASFLGRHGDGPAPSLAEARELRTGTNPAAHDLSDLAHLSGVDPLRLWVIRRLLADPDATEEELLAGGAEARRQAFRWLFRTERTDAQDRRIRTVLEEDAFRAVGRRWRALGYPFSEVVPSLATALGSSGDRPAALAELVGTIRDGGLRRPAVHTRALRFAGDTPYETRLVRDSVPGERVLSRPVARAASRLLAKVVTSGTARRAAAEMTGPDGEALTVGGKTGTGDNRRRTFGPGGEVVDSRPVSRTATFVFHVGDRLSGAITAAVLGREAGGYRFTSSLPVELFTRLRPTLERLLARPRDVPRERSAPRKKGPSAN